MLTLLLLACKPDPTPEPPGCQAVGAPSSLDSWGGHADLSWESTGFFRVDSSCGRWWFVTPEGHPFYATGVNHATSYADYGQVNGVSVYAQTVADTYGDAEAWADATADRLRGWGVNVAGSWSDYDRLGARMAYAVNLSLADGDWQSGAVADWFDPAWSEAVQSTVAAQVSPRAQDPNLLGYFLDNELRWGTDWRGADKLIELYLAKGATAPGKAVAVDEILAFYGDINAANAALSTSFADRDAMLAATDWDIQDPTLITRFISRAAEQYFATTTAAIRAADPNHLVLGNRESAPVTPMEAWRAAAAHVDVLSANNYVYLDGVVDAARALSGAPDPAGMLAAMHAELDLPLLITEYGFRADDSGLPNTWPPIYPTFDTQAERTDAWEDYVREAQAAPWVVGHHWFEFCDQPVEGRFDGEDNNWGMVNELDEPYPELTARMTEVNAEIWQELALPPE